MYRSPRSRGAQRQRSMFMRITSARPEGDCTSRANAVVRDRIGQARRQILFLGIREPVAMHVARAARPAKQIGGVAQIGVRELRIELGYALLREPRPLPPVLRLLAQRF